LHADLLVGASQAGAYLAAGVQLKYKLGRPMGAQLEPYQLVRVARLLHESAHYDGWKLNQRPPGVGDLGTIVDILHAPGVPDGYVVESSGEDGVTIWLGDFLAEELEPA
jgi:hypothetical protein